MWLHKQIAVLASADLSSSAEMSAVTSRHGAISIFQKPHSSLTNTLSFNHLRRQCRIVVCREQSMPYAGRVSDVNMNQ